MCKIQNIRDNSFARFSTEDEEDLRLSLPIEHPFLIVFAVVLLVVTNGSFYKNLLF